jgi:hypothetical protein
LDNSSLLATIKIAQREIVAVSSTSVADPQNAARSIPVIYLYDSAHHLHIYSVNLTYSGKGMYDVQTNILDVKAVVSKITTVNLYDHKLYPLCMTAITIKRPMDQIANHNLLLARTRLLFHHPDRRLTMLLLHDNQREVVLDTGVDQFWIESEISYENRTVFFTYHGSDSKKGVKLTMRDLAEEEQGFFSSWFSAAKLTGSAVNNLIQYDPDACPLGVFKEAGIFLHASETGMSKMANAMSPYYEIQPKMYPYMHGILLSALLENYQEESEDLQLARRERLLRFMKVLNIEERLTYVATLEWMLHCVLSNEDSLIEKNDSAFCIVRITGGAQGKREATPIGPGLHLIVKFLRLFPQFYEIIINCVRKTDIVLWGRLFEVIGEQPRQMFDKCLKQGGVHEAANMLRILQQTEGLPHANACAYDLLRPVLSLGNWELARDMIRYIHMIESELQETVEEKYVFFTYD